jgi:hypothetical protein
MTCSTIYYINFEFFGFGTFWKQALHIPTQASLSFCVALCRTEEVVGCCQDSNLLTVNYPVYLSLAIQTPEAAVLPWTVNT